MTDNRPRTNPSQDALTEPTEGHVDIDSASAAHGGASETLAGMGGAAGQEPAGIIAGAGLTDHDQPVEGGREDPEDEDADFGGPGTRQEHEGTSFGG